VTPKATASSKRQPVRNIKDVASIIVRPAGVNIGEFFKFWMTFHAMPTLLTGTFEFLDLTTFHIFCSEMIFPGQFFFQKRTVDYPLLVITLFKITHPQDVVSDDYSKNSRLLIIVRTISE
jgi:hypothetical protein